MSAAVLLLAAWAAAAPTARPRSVVDEAESALWDDHADVRDACFLLERAGISARDLARALEAARGRPGASDGERRRARRLLARLGPDGERCRARKPPKRL